MTDFETNLIICVNPDVFVYCHLLYHFQIDLISQNGPDPNSYHEQNVIILNITISSLKYNSYLESSWLAVLIISTEAGFFN